MITTWTHKTMSSSIVALWASVWHEWFWVDGDVCSVVFMFFGDAMTNSNLAPCRWKFKLVLWKNWIRTN